MFVIIVSYFNRGFMVYVITGGGSGIGKAVAKNLIAREQSVLIVGRREELLASTAETSPLISYVVADVGTNSGRETVYQKLKNHKIISALINNAGTIDPISKIQKIKELDWRHTMAINLEAPLFLTQLLYEKLIGGRVLNISSGAAHFPVIDWAAYCVSKAGLHMLTQCWNLESREIACASVCPGIVDTAMQAKIRATHGMELKKREFFIKLKEQNQLVTVETVAMFITWLLLDIDKERYVAKEWDIYDTSHHHEWLKPPHIVPVLER